jgi:antibiotic biosynthesis monooxygenase (ABM) superfamily enzyme
MAYIEQLHLDAINDSEYQLIKHSAIYQIDKEDAAKKSAEITKKIAIEFAEWLDYTNEQVKENSNYESWFEEFLKPKQPNDGIQTS